MQVKKEIKSIIELVPNTIDSILEDLTVKTKIAEENVFDLRLILEEAITNAIKHGNEYNTGRSVNITAEIKDDLCEIVVEDQGEGFDHSGVPDPLKEEELKSSGRGIYLIKKLAQEVEFNEEGTQLRIVKKVQLV